MDTGTPSPMTTGEPVEVGEIQEYARQIASLFDTERIILFGSYARGNQGAGSDVDLLVLMDFEGMPQDQAYRIRRALPRKFSLDLIVRRPCDVEHRVQMGDFFLKEALEEGRVLHERTGA